MAESGAESASHRAMHGRIVSHVSTVAGDMGPTFFCPAFAALPARIADITATLPITDANADLIAALDRLPAGGARCYAGVLAVDPFRRSTELLGELFKRGVYGVINLPSLMVLDGEYRDAMASMGFSFEAELAFLRRARTQGLAAAAMVGSVNQAHTAVEAGIDLLVLHPGLPHGEGLSDRQLAAACLSTARRLRGELSPEVTLLVFCHPDLGESMASAAAAADGDVHYEA